MKHKKYAIIISVALLAALFFIVASVYDNPKAKSDEPTSNYLTTEIITAIRETTATTVLQTIISTSQKPVITTEEFSSAEKTNTEEDTFPDEETTRKTFRKSKSGDNYECFESCAFIGNSRTLDLKDFGLVKNVYASVGVNVSTIYTKCAPGSSRPIMDEIGRKHYDKYFIQLGENECGWPSESTFIAKYKKIIEDIKEKDPRAKIYLQSMIPITKSASDKAEFDCTNERINTFNALIKQLAKDEGVRFIDVAAAFKDRNGNLPDDAAYDGIHLTKTSCEKWLDVIEKKM